MGERNKALDPEKNELSSLVTSQQSNLLCPVYQEHVKYVITI